MSLIDFTLDSGLSKEEAIAPNELMRDYVVNTILEHGKEVEEHKVERFNELLRFLGIEEIDYQTLVVQGERSKSELVLKLFAQYLTDHTDMKGDADYFLKKGLFTISKEDGSCMVDPSLIEHLVAFYESLEDPDDKNQSS